MIIERPTIERVGGRARVSAVVRSDRRPAEPIVLWFEFPEKFADRLSDRGDAFLAAVLPPAMAWGEDITVRAPLSPALVSGAMNFQKVFNGWLPDVYKIAAIRGETMSQPPAPPTPASASAFSGGIDSFFTLLTHLPAKEPAAQHPLRYLLFIHGSDIPLADRSTYETARASYDRLAADLGLELVPAATNFRTTSLAGALPWGMAHGGVLIGTALAFGRMMTSFYVPSSFGFGFPAMHGSDPELDHWLSTESLQIVHDGSEFTRVDKTKVVAEFAPSYDRLRVCWARPNGLRNCGRCEKCVRTMLTLDLLGALPRFSTFPPGLKPDPGRWLIKTEGELLLAKEIRALALEKGRPDVADKVDRNMARCLKIRAWADKAVRLSHLTGHPAEHLRHLVFFLCHRLPL